MRSVLLAVLLASCAIPSIAWASLELGVPSTVALNLERDRWSIGLGLDLLWATKLSAVAMTDSGTFVVDDNASRVVLRPAVAARFFLNNDRDVQPFVVTRVQREVPMASSDFEEVENDLEDEADSWSVGLGGGIRSRLNERLAIGGEAAAVAQFYSADDRDATFGETRFMIFLQYAP